MTRRLKSLIEPRSVSPGRFFAILETTSSAQIVSASGLSNTRSTQALKSALPLSCARVLISLHASLFGFSSGLHFLSKASISSSKTVIGVKKLYDPGLPLICCDSDPKYGSRFFLSENRVLFQISACQGISKIGQRETATSHITQSGVIGWGMHTSN